LGFEVTGLDIGPGMLERTRSKSAGLPVEWVQGDARSFYLGRQFWLIHLTGNAFQAFLTRRPGGATVACARAPARRGPAAFETRNPR
jgi:hypothetical protein